MATCCRISARMVRAHIFSLHLPNSFSFLLNLTQLLSCARLLRFCSNNLGINHFRITAICGDYYVGTFIAPSAKKVCSAIAHRISGLFYFCLNVRTLGGRKFKSLSHLIGYYTSLSDLLKKERLLHPVQPPEASVCVTANWRQSRSQLLIELLTELNIFSPCPTTSISSLGCRTRKCLTLTS